MIRCRECGKRIVFMTNHKGHRVPCDIDYHPTDGLLEPGRYFDRYGGEYVWLPAGRWAAQGPPAVLELRKQHTHNHNMR